MNEQALKDAYDLFVQHGYTKSFDEYKNLIATNDNALKDSYDIFTGAGYKKSIDDFSVLLGVKKKEDTATNSGSSMDSQSGTSSLDSSSNPSITPSQKPLQMSSQDTRIWGEGFTSANLQQPFPNAQIPLPRYQASELQHDPVQEPTPTLKEFGEQNLTPKQSEKDLAPTPNVDYEGEKNFFTVDQADKFIKDHSYNPVVNNPIANDLLKGAAHFLSSAQQISNTPNENPRAGAYSQAMVHTADFVDDMLRSLNSGTVQGDAVAPAAAVALDGKYSDPETLKKYIATANALKDVAPSKEMENYQKAVNETPGMFGIMKGLAENPTIAPEVMVSSLKAMMNSESLKAATAAIATGAAGGAGIGAFFGGAGAIPGAIVGGLAAIPYAFAAAGATLETASSFSDFLKEELGDKAFTEDNVKAVLNDPEKLSKIRNRALTRGITIGVVDAFTGKLAGKLGAKVLTRNASALGKAAVVGSAVEAAGGMGGEALGQKFSGQQMNLSDIVLEGIGEMPTGVANVVAEVAQAPSFSINGERVTGREISDVVNTATGEELQQMKFDIKRDKSGLQERINDKVVTAQITNEVTQANPTLDEEQVNNIVEAEKQIRALEGNTTELAKAKKKTLREFISTVTEAAPQAEQVDVKVPGETITATAEEIAQPNEVQKLESAPIVNEIDQEVSDFEKLLAESGIITAPAAPIETIASETAKVSPTEQISQNEATTEQTPFVNEKLQASLPELESRGVTVTATLNGLETITGKLEPSDQRDFSKGDSVLKEGTDRKTGERIVTKYVYKDTRGDLIADNFGRRGYYAVSIPLPEGVSARDVEYILDAKIAELEATYDRKQGRGEGGQNIDRGKVNNALPINKAQLIGNNAPSESVVTETTTIDNGVPISDTVRVAELSSRIQSPEKVKILEQAKRAAKTLKSILPTFDIVIHDTADSYNAAMDKIGGPKNTAGSFSYRKNADGTYIGSIDINLQNATGTTVPHEVAHAVLLKAFGDNPTIFKNFRKKLSAILSDSTNAGLNSFASMYDDSVSAEEYLVELTAMLSNNQGKIEPTILQKIAALVNQFVSKLTNGAVQVFKETASAKDVIDFFNSISSKISQGEDINIAENKLANSVNRAQQYFYEISSDISKQIDAINDRLEAIRRGQDVWVEIEKYIVGKKFNPVRLKAELGAANIGKKQDVSPSTVTMENLVEDILTRSEFTNMGISENDKAKIENMVRDYVLTVGKYETVEQGLRSELKSKTAELKAIDKNIKLAEKQEAANAKENAKLNAQSAAKEPTLLDAIEQMTTKEELVDTFIKQWGLDPTAAENLANEYLDKKAKETNNSRIADQIVKLGREKGYSDNVLLEVLKRQGISEKQITSILGENNVAPKPKTKVNIKPEPKNVTVKDEYRAMVDQIKLEAKAANEGKKSVSDAIKAIVAYFNKIKDRGNLTRKDISNILVIISKVKDQKTLDAAAEKIYKIVNNAKSDIVEVDDKKEMVKLIKLQAKVAREAKADVNTFRKMIGKVIAKMETSGKITTKQAQVIMKKFGELNVDNIAHVERFFQYAEKMFADAQYNEKLDTARANIKKLKKQIKNAAKNTDLRQLAREFLEVDPSMVEDIDKYNDTADQILESLVGSKADKKSGTFTEAEIASNQKVMDYVWREVAIQQEEKRKIQELIQQQMDESTEDPLTEEELQEIAESNAKLAKEKHEQLREMLKDRFDALSDVIVSMINEREDPFTYEPVSFTESQKKNIVGFMGMDLDLLSDKEAAQAIDALNNFITNRSIAGMEAMVGTYTGRRNAIEVKKKGIVAKLLRLYWNRDLGQTTNEQAINISLTFERFFKGIDKGRYVEKMMGVRDFLTGCATALKESNNIAKEYVDTFYKQKANGEAFNTAENDVERGMVAFMIQHLYGTDVKKAEEFNNRKEIVQKSIEKMKKGSVKEREKAVVYEKAYQKLVENANNTDDVRAAADPTNLKAVDFWIDKWSSKFDRFAALSEGIYNKILDKYSNYTPERFARLEYFREKKNIADDDSAFHSNNGTVYKKEAGSLKERAQKKSFPEGRYLDLSFDKVNVGAMQDALTDLETAQSIRQIDAFKNSQEFEDIFPDPEDRKVLEDRVSNLVAVERGKQPFDNSAFNSMARGITAILGNIGASTVLGGITQAPKQLTAFVNTMINTGGRVDFRGGFNKAKMDFVRNSGHAIGNRGVKSQADITHINQLLDYAAKNPGEKAIKAIGKVSDFYMKWTLEKPDVFAASVSWMSYYEQSLRNQNINPEGFETRPVNEEAADYASQMVDRNLNTSDPNTQGLMFTDKDGFKRLVLKALLPFASFRMNATARLNSDMITLSSKTSNIGDRKLAAASASATIAEIAFFTALSTAIGYTIAGITRSMMGRNDGEEDKKKRMDTAKKGAYTRVAADLFSPIPFLDKVIAARLNDILEPAQDLAGISEEDRIELYDKTSMEVYDLMGSLGITFKRTDQFVEAVQLVRKGEYKDQFGKVHTITEEDRKFLQKYVLLASALSTVGLAPTEVDGFARNAIKTAKKGGSEAKKAEAAKKKSDKASKLQGYQTETEMKKYDPDLYEATYGKDSPNYEAEQAQRDAEREAAKEQQKIKDEQYGYKKPEKKSNDNRWSGKKNSRW